MSDFKYVETTIGYLHEIKNNENGQGRSKPIKVSRQVAILRPVKIGGKSITFTIKILLIFCPLITARIQIMPLSFKGLLEIALE